MNDVTLGPLQCLNQQQGWRHSVKKARSKNCSYMHTDVFPIQTSTTIYWRYHDIVVSFRGDFGCQHQDACLPLSSLCSFMQGDGSAGLSSEDGWMEICTHRCHCSKTDLLFASKMGSLDPDHNERVTVTSRDFTVPLRVSSLLILFKCPSCSIWVSQYSHDMLISQIQSQLDFILLPRTHY
jgi:hypothetical protein